MKQFMDRLGIQPALFQKDVRITTEERNIGLHHWLASFTREGITVCYEYSQLHVEDPDIGDVFAEMIEDVAIVRNQTFREWCKATNRNYDSRGALEMYLNDQDLCHDLFKLLTEDQFNEALEIINDE